MTRKVSFGKTTVFEYAESKEHSDYRKPYWEFFYIDHLRFKMRIKLTESLLSPVLLQHVNKVKEYKKDDY